MSTAPSSDKANVGEGGVAELARKAAPLLDSQCRHSNVPSATEPRMRTVGFTLHEDVVGLSHGLFMLEALVELARIGAALSPSPLVLGGQGVSSCTFVSAATPQEGRPANVEPSAGEG